MFLEDIPLISAGPGWRLGLLIGLRSCTLQWCRASSQWQLTFARDLPVPKFPGRKDPALQRSTAAVRIALDLFCSSPAKDAADRTAPHLHSPISMRPSCLKPTTSTCVTLSQYSPVS